MFIILWSYFFRCLLCAWREVYLQTIRKHQWALLHLRKKVELNWISALKAISMKFVKLFSIIFPNNTKQWSIIFFCSYLMEKALGVRECGLETKLFTVLPPLLLHDLTWYSSNNILNLIASGIRRGNGLNIRGLLFSFRPIISWSFVYACWEVIIEEQKVYCRK